jgi:nitrate/nitrite transporter NarK
VNAASGRAVMSWFAPAQRGFALGIRQTAVPLGGAAAALFLPPAAAAGGWRCSCRRWCAGALSSSWNGLSFTAAAELAGRARSGAALGFQQTALSVAAAATPPVFASVVEQGSWALGFGLAALLPLAGIGLMRRLTV